MSNEKQNSGSPIPGIIVGVVLMVAGTFVATNAHHAVEAIQKAEATGGQVPASPWNGLAQFMLSLEHQGVPVDPGKTLATIGVFLILFPVIKSFFLTPLVSAINERNQDLERTFSEAEMLRSEMQSMRAAYEQRIAQTEAQAREQIQSQIREAQALRQTLMSEATEKADSLVQRAQQEIAAERDRVVADLRVQVADLALSAAERVIGENMDNDRNRRLVEDFINSAEVVR